MWPVAAHYDGLQSIPTRKNPDAKVAKHYYSKTMSLSSIVGQILYTLIRYYVHTCTIIIIPLIIIIERDP